VSFFRIDEVLLREMVNKRFVAPRNPADCRCTSPGGHIDIRKVRTAITGTFHRDRKICPSSLI
jgi:hypothetical protein